MAQGTQIVWSAKALRLMSEVAVSLADFVGVQKANTFQIDLINDMDKRLPQFPEGCPPCRFLKLKQAGCRCCVYKKQYIVVSKVEGGGVRIIGVVSAKRNPKIFNDLI